MFGFSTRPGEGRFFPFLLALVVLFALGPILGYLGLDDYYRLAFVAVLLAGVWSLSRVRRHFFVALALLAPSVLTQVFAFAAESPLSAAIAAGSSTFVVMYVTAVLFGAVMRGDQSNVDTIAGAACVYLLLGLLWTLFYGVLEYVVPGSLVHTGPVDASVVVQQDSLTYFSFVTLTTLGFGDVLPTNVAAQTLAWSEAVVGQLYVAVVLAVLVGSYVARATEKDSLDRSALAESEGDES